MKLDPLLSVDPKEIIVVSFIWIHVHWISPKSTSAQNDCIWWSGKCHSGIGFYGGVITVIGNVMMLYQAGIADDSAYQKHDTQWVTGYSVV